MDRRAFKVNGLFGMILVLAFLTTVAGEDKITPGEMTPHPLLETIGIELAFAGDDNRNATATLEYRDAENANWKAGHPLSRLSESGENPREFVGCVFRAKPDTEYELKITWHDPDGVTGKAMVACKVRTLKEPPAGNVGGRTYCVSPDGSDKDAGTRAAPWKTIGYAASKAAPGDTVILLPGFHEPGRWGQTIGCSGTAEAPIIFKAAVGGEPVIVSGLDRKMSAPGALTWEKDPDVPGGYMTAMAQRPGYVAFGKRHLLPLRDVRDLTSGKYSIAGKDGWVWGDGKLHVKLPENADPSRTGLNFIVGDKDKSLLTIRNASHVIVEGLTLEFAGNAISVDASHHIVLRNNTIRNVWTGIASGNWPKHDISQFSHHLLIEGNDISDSEASLDWDWGYSHDQVPTNGILLTTGGHQIVRRNRVHDCYNGIFVAQPWGPTAGGIADERFSSWVDLHGNELWNISDDGFEIEGAGKGVVIRDNFLRDMHTGFSLAPVLRGPVYCFGNTILMRSRKLPGGDYDPDFGNAPFKFNVNIEDAGRQGPTYLYHNTSVVHALVPKARRKREPVPALTTAWENTPGFNLTTRNNIFVSIPGGKRPISIYTKKQPLFIDMDYDNLYVESVDGEVTKREELTRCDFNNALETHGMNIKPQFVDFQGFDFRLPAGSPLIDKGIHIPGINDDYKGKAPDIGAFEYGAPKVEPRRAE